MSLNSLPPLVFKSFIGFDELFDEISRINHNKDSNYPAFDVIKTDEKNYEINLAVAGFSESEIEIISLQNILYIKGKKVQNNSQNIIHKGIALSPFEKIFILDPVIEVTEAILSQGLLNIKLFKREPEIIKPKRIEIKTT